MKPDFSHYSLETPWTVAKRVERGGPIADETLLKAFEQIDRPFLSARETKFVSAILKRKRGPRFSLEGSVDELAQRIRATKREALPIDFLNALAARLLLPKGLSQFELLLRNHLKFEKRRRDLGIRILYPLFRDLQADGKMSVYHPDLGRVAVPLHIEGRSERALEMVHAYLWKRGYFMPSPQRILNIAISA